jgi:predicted DCC family thiol-disulfide oxidoreductase YuxK
MISLSSEMTDAKGSRAARGWVFFDRDCRICRAFAQRFRRTLESRGFGLAALQDPRVQALLNLPPGELLREMRVAATSGEVAGGAAAIIYLARQIWWAWPLYLISKIPGAMPVFNAGYRWFADHRTCARGACLLPGSPNRFASDSKGGHK